MMYETDICFCIVKKIGEVFRIKTQTGQSAMFFCVLGKLVQTEHRVKARLSYIEVQPSLFKT
jgi:hypothetical protein